MTHNLDQQRYFYTKVLELTLSLSANNQFAITIGNSTLVFTSTSQSRPLSYHFAFNIPEQQFAEAKQWLTRRVTLLTEPSGADEFFFSNWQAHSVYFPDLDGNIVEFIARHTLPHSQPFTSTNLICISEIGLVVEDVPDFVRQIETQVGSQVYRDASGEMFGAVGDENGLFIVVKRDRLWFPDRQVAAQEAPITARISENARDFWIEGPPYHFRPA